MSVIGMTNEERKVAVEAMTTAFVRQCKAGSIPVDVRNHLTTDEKQSIMKVCGPSDDGEPCEDNNPEDTKSK